MDYCEYFSQGNEDIILEAVFRNISNGRYVDVGCFHPSKYSNTYKLYRNGWSGLCFDAYSEHKEQFQRERPKDRLFEIAISNFNGNADFYIGKSGANNSLIKSTRFHTDKVRIPTRKLDDLLTEEQFPQNFELLSVDTEGTEIDVLDGLNLNKWRPRIIVAEYNTAMKINLKLQPYLIQHGYHILAITTWNVIASRCFEEDHAFSAPPKYLEAIANKLK